MAQVIAILSGKGGTGKSLICCGIGEALAKEGKHVLLADGSQGLRSLELFLGMTDGILYSCPDLADGKCEIEDVLVEDEAHPGLWLLPAAQNLPSDRNLKEVYGAALQKAAAGGEDIPAFDFILIDCGGSLESQLSLSRLASRPLLVVTPDPAGLRAADKLRKLTEKEPDMILSRFHTKDMADGILPSVPEIQELLPLNILGILEENDGVRRAVLQGKDICREMPEFTHIADRLQGKDVPLPRMPEASSEDSGTESISQEKPEKISAISQASEHRGGFFRRLFQRGQK
ncbi:MAG: AAA family ATPase [Lachnospiraceae bacterium]|jgi:septum site-determining protein MinD